MAEEKKATKDVDFVSQGRNWEQRVLSEMESPHKWKDTWGKLFENEVPFDYEKKIQYLESKLKETGGDSKLAQPPKYGVGQPFKEVAAKDYRRKKMFADGDDT